MLQFYILYYIHSNYIIIMYILRMMKLLFTVEGKGSQRKLSSEERNPKNVGKNPGSECSDYLGAMSSKFQFMRNLN